MFSHRKIVETTGRRQCFRGRACRPVRCGRSVRAGAQRNGVRGV